LSESTSSSLLTAARAGNLPRTELLEFAARNPSAFFREVIEPLSDSFDPADVQIYESIMRMWVPPAVRADPVIPARVETVYVLSRVTLGADVKITSIVLSAMKQRFAGANIVLVGGSKASGLFASDKRISFVAAEYPRSGSVEERIAFVGRLHELVSAPFRIVVDPDSRMTQLGLLPPCEAENHFHFPSRDIGGLELNNLTTLTQAWLRKNFAVSGSAQIAPERVSVTEDKPYAAVSFGVGGNLSKCVPGGFEPGVIRVLAQRYPKIWVDRGAGGEESQRATAAVEASGAADRVRFWEGSFAGFASITANSHLYLGYDSAGQHAAAALGVPLITIFAGATSARFRARWSPAGPGPITIIDAAGLGPEACLERVRQSLPA
jgi:ADP-heptose:LPS heptosyltransferase